TIQASANAERPSPMNFARSGYTSPRSPASLAYLPISPGPPNPGRRTGDDDGVNNTGQPALLPPASARSLLLTVVGEFCYPRDDAVWTTALIRVLGGLGVESHAARQAITRSAEAGWIVSERHGRAVRWRLTDEGRAVVEDGFRHAA